MLLETFEGEKVKKVLNLQPPVAQRIENTRIHNTVSNDLGS